MTDLTPRHENNGNCAKCDEIFDRYPNFVKILRDWFKALQEKHPEAHISCAGRGKEEQEDAHAKRLSRAHYGESAHNFNAAIDLFELQGDKGNLYERAWFRVVVAPNIPAFLNWYGAPGSKFYELPHVEIRDWKSLASKKVFTLVE